jgi:hypothetical protein
LGKPLRWGGGGEQKKKSRKGNRKKKDRASRKFEKKFVHQESLKKKSCIDSSIRKILSLNKKFVQGIIIFIDTSKTLKRYLYN